MTEFEDIVTAVLRAELSGELSGIKSIVNTEYEPMEGDVIVVQAFQERTINHKQTYKYVEGRLNVTALAAMTKDEPTEYKIKLDLSEAYMRKVERVVMADAGLNGLTTHKEQTHFEQKTRGAGQDKAGLFMMTRAVLVAHYLYRDGVIALK